MNTTSAAATTTTTPPIIHGIFERGPANSARTVRAPVAAASFDRLVSAATRLPPLMRGCGFPAYRRHSTHLLRSTSGSRQHRGRVAEAGDGLNDLVGRVGGGPATGGRARPSVRVVVG